jgi:hypothetical protein
VVIANQPVPVGAAGVLAGRVVVVAVAIVRPGPMVAVAAQGLPEAGAGAAGPPEEVKIILYKQKPRMSVNAYRGFVFYLTLG